MASPKKLETYIEAQKMDKTCKQLDNFATLYNWLDKDTYSSKLSQYWKEKQSFSICDELIAERFFQKLCERKHFKNFIKDLKEK